jgi:EAL domain-containing protein (putative c-di-GMP-specific phosphodiesterase class I)
VNTIKIDRIFIADVPQDYNNAQLVSTIIIIAHNLNFNVLEERVETLEQLRFLQDNDCDYYQGYLVSKPAPAEAFEVMLRTRA